MMTPDELQRLRDLPIEGVAPRLGITVSRGRFLCPAHADHHPSASVSKKGGGRSWKCWSCGAGGNAIDLAMHVLNKTFREACLWLADSQNIILRQAAEVQPTPAAGGKTWTFDPTRYARFFEHPWLSPEARRFLYDERLIDPRVVGWCRLTSWCDRGGVAWLQIPYLDADGRLIGVQNRNLGNACGLPRFRFVPGSRCSIYNLPVLRLLKPGEECWIAEGSSDCWSLLSDHRKAIAIASATMLLPPERELLVRVSRELGVRWRMSPDNDEPGRKLASQLQAILPDLQLMALPEGVKDYSEYYVGRRCPLN